jgi:transcriptional regulator with XRE-family HTH domain
VYPVYKLTGISIYMAIKENLARIRRDKKMSQVKLAEISGVSQQSISRLENGVDLTSKHLPQLARALGVPVHELDDQYGADDGIEVVSAPLISWVSAGQLQKPEVPVSDFADARRVSTVGLSVDRKWIALKVVGDSMDRISPPDSIIFVDLNDRRLVANACYIIQDDEGGASYKRYRPGKWQPVSTNKRHKAYLIKGDHGPKVIGRVKRTVLDL